MQMKIENKWQQLSQNQAKQTLKEKNLYFNKLENLEQMEGFLDTHNLLFNES